ncbi:thiamine phosphate synthase, partial [Gammaproteobacteria bacterium]|nr:thiamine phosphate synthase [Gammaproteobacteria bacterium]
MPPILYMTDEVRAPNPIPSINKLIPGSGVIFRHYNFKSRLELGVKVKLACRKNGCLFIVGGDTSLAIKLNADGLHLPEYLVLNPSLKAKLWRQKPNKILTAAAHCQKSLMTSMAFPVDAALLSPIFPTNSHLNQNNLGILKFQKLTKQVTVDVYALGGINNKNAIQLINSPAIGIAGI